MVAITVIFMQLLRLAGGDQNRISIILGIILVLSVVLVFPMIFVFACVVAVLEGLVGTRCPSCRHRQLEWRSGSWKYGEPPDYRYFACANCGARFRQLCGGQGVLSDLEKA
jgi:DNA-directed RNA polymerase subunit RPC12/RpoP